MKLKKDMYQNDVIFIRADYTKGINEEEKLYQ